LYFAKYYQQKAAGAKEGAFLMHKKCAAFLNGLAYDITLTCPPLIGPYSELNLSIENRHQGILVPRVSPTTFCHPCRELQPPIIGAYMLWYLLPDPHEGSSSPLIAVPKSMLFEKNLVVISIDRVAVEVR
jgi:hypothetical protein